MQRRVLFAIWVPLLVVLTFSAGSSRSEKERHASEGPGWCCECRRESRDFEKNELVQKHPGFPALKKALAAPLPPRSGWRKGEKVHVVLLEAKGQQQALVEECFGLWKAQDVPLEFQIHATTSDFFKAIRKPDLEKKSGTHPATALLEGGASIAIRFVSEGKTDPRTKKKIGAGMGGSSGVGKAACLSLIAEDGFYSMLLENIPHVAGPALAQAQAKKVILHEIGHALGLHHEHQNTNMRPFKWNEDAVKMYFKTVHGWTDEETRNFVLDPAPIKYPKCPNFQPDSIMLYDIPAGWTKPGMAYTQAKKISPCDAERVTSLLAP